MKIYTRTGDDGTTSLFSGGRVPKHHLRVESYGTVDELNSVLGLARSLGAAAPVDDYLARIQRQLFTVGADLATPLEGSSQHVVRVNEAMIPWLEQNIDTMTADLPPLTAFILPGGTAPAAQIHVGRTICRRAERLVVTLHDHDAINPLVLPYLNRLSDFLFTLARWQNWHAGVDDVTWSKDDLL